MGKHVTVTIQGYGVVKVKRPKQLTKATSANMVADAVAQTMNLVDPRTQRERFHMAVPGGHAS